MSAKPAKWQLDFVRRVGSVSDMTGLPPSMIQVFAWLVVCDPPEQTADELRATLGLSAGAISAATTTLARMGVVDKLLVPGTRRARYVLRPASWERLMRLRVETTLEMERIAGDAIAHARSRQPRLEEMRELYGWWGQKLGEMLHEGPRQTA